MKPNPSPRQTSFFVALALLFMLTIKFGFMGEHKYIRDLRANMHSGTVIQDNTFYKPEGDAQIIASVNQAELPHSNPPDLAMSAADPLYQAYQEYMRGRDNQLNLNNSLPKAIPKTSVSHLPGHGKVVIIIDDLGMNRTQSMAMVNIEQAPLTLAFLPYAPQLKGITSSAIKNGHELMIHTPMEPMNSDLDPGPMALMDEMTENELRLNLKHIFQSFEGYKGINNHMGSRLTQNPEAMRVVMSEVAARGLYFVDSKTIAGSVAGDAAALYDVPFAERHVFLDHEESVAFVNDALVKLERLAKKNGMAIAIGHPKTNTVNALKSWLPSLKSRGLELVPASAVVQKHPKTIRPVAVHNRVITPSSGAAPVPLNQSPSQLQQIEPATY